VAEVPNGTPAAWSDALPPTRSAALARIAGVRPAEYARTRNHLDGAVTGLSPYLTHGLVTLREVLAGVLQREPLPVQHKLVFEPGRCVRRRPTWPTAPWSSACTCANTTRPGPGPRRAGAGWTPRWPR